VTVVGKSLISIGRYGAQDARLRAPALWMMMFLEEPPRRFS